MVGQLQDFGHTAESAAGFYWICLLVAVGCTLAVLNLLRAPTGRAFVAIRDSEISAQSMGIHLAYCKTLSFALSAALAGIGGALYAHKIRFLSPDQFGVLQTIDLLLLLLLLLLMVVIRGLGSVHGAFLGAMCLILLPQLIAAVKDGLPPAIGQAPGLQGAVYGLVLIVFVLFEPLGQGAHLAAAVPVLPARAFQASEEFPEIEASAVSAVLLSAHEPTLRFGGIVAVNRVSFELREGDVFTLIGPNARIWALRAPSRTSSCSSAYFSPSRPPISAERGQRFRRTRTPFQAERGQRFNLIPDTPSARK